MQIASLGDIAVQQAVLNRPLALPGPEDRSRHHLAPCAYPVIARRGKETLL